MVAIDGEGELPEMGRSTPGHFLFSASPLMQEFFGVESWGGRKMADDLHGFSGEVFENFSPHGLKICIIWESFRGFPRGLLVYW